MLSMITNQPGPGTAIVLNGTPVGAVTVRPVLGPLESIKAANQRDRRDHIYFTDPSVCLPGGGRACAHPTYVATGDQLSLTTFKKNILMVDGHRVDLLGVDDKVQTVGEGTKAALRRLPQLTSPATVGVVAAGAVSAALLRGVRSPKTLLVTGGIAAGVAGLGAVSLSFFRARHPGALPGWLK